MRVFKEFNGLHGDFCPVCGTAEKKETILVALDGTEDDGIVEAKQYHLDCVDLRSKKLDGTTLVYMNFVPIEEGSDGEVEN